MRNLLCRWFNLVKEEDYIELYRMLKNQNKEFKEVILLHKMQGAWQEVKENRRVVH